MTYEELDADIVARAINKCMADREGPGLALVIAKLAREETEARTGYTPPVAIDPEVGSIWKHYNGNVYEVIAIANTLDTEKYPKAVIHKNTANGTVWTRRADDWHRSYTQQAKNSETPPAPVDPDIAEAKRIAENWDEIDELVYAGIKRGRELERREAKPGMVWVKNRGLGTPNGAAILTLDENGDFDITFGSLAFGLEEDVTHYAIIPHPAEDVA